MLSSRHIMVSSAYCRIAILIGTKLSTKPVIKLFYWAESTILVRTSTKILNSKGEGVLLPYTLMTYKVGTN
jgi:hypothetical protein